MYVVLYRYVLMYRDSGDVNVYKSGGVVGVFLVFSPPSERVENSEFILVIPVEKSGG